MARAQPSKGKRTKNATGAKRSASIPENEAQAPPTQQPVSPEEAIAVAAYYRAERRGFAPGFELQDWLEAEQEILNHR